VAESNALDVPEARRHLEAHTEVTPLLAYLREPQRSLPARGRRRPSRAFFSGAQKNDKAKICACVSRAVGGGLVLDSAYRDE
jgi:hypothetical protein